MTPDQPRTPERDGPVLRPRTVTPGVDRPEAVVRPRTIAPLGRPDPITAPTPAAFADITWEPPLDRAADPASFVAVEHLDDALDVGSEPDDIWVSDLATGEVRVEELADLGDGRLTGDSSADSPSTDDDEPDGSRMLRNNVLVAAGTMLSRITGLLRTVVMFWALSHTLRDAYLLANNTPNMVYELILGGVLTATLVPLFSQFVANDDDEATSAVLSVALVALAAVTVIGLLAAPALVSLYATNTPEGVSRGDYLSVSLRLALLFAPQVFFYGLMAVGSALLNSRRRFFAAAWAPVLNNVVVIGILFAVGYWGSKPDLQAVQDRPWLLWVLGLGTTAGIVLMAIALIPAIRRANIPVRFTWAPRHPGVRKAMTMSGWTIGYVAANLIAAQVIIVLAEPGSGGPSNYQLAFQFFQLPHGLLAVSLMTTFLPEFARAFARDDAEMFANRLLSALRLLGVVMLPAVILYIAVPLSTLVAGARVDPDAALFGIRLGEAAEVSRIVAAFAAGLLGFSLYLFVMRAFYARGDTKTPFFLNCFENLLNVVLAVALVGRWGVVGLALAYGIAYTIGAVVSAVVLIRRLEVFDVADLVGTYARLGVAGLAMGAAAFAAGWAFHTQQGTMLVAGAAAAGVAGLVVYPLALAALRVPELSGLTAKLRRR